MAFDMANWKRPQHFRPDYNSEHFKQWQDQNPLLPAEFYLGISNDNPYNPDPDYVFGENSEWDAKQNFYRMENPTVEDALAIGHTPKGYTASPDPAYKPSYAELPEEEIMTKTGTQEGIGIEPFYADMPKKEVLSSALASGFEPNYAYNPVENIAPYQGPVVDEYAGYTKADVIAALRKGFHIDPRIIQALGIQPEEQFMFDILDMSYW